jgi:hypothetical protein
MTPLLPELYGQARRDTAQRLRLRSEAEAAAALPAACPYTLEQILDSDWLPE